MDPDAAAAEFADLFPQIYRRFYRRLAPDLHRLTSESIAALHHLEMTGPLTVAEAAQHLDRSQSAMSEMIDRLERRGLVARIPDQRDRRRTLVWLTDDGRAALDKAHQVLSTALLRHGFAAMEPGDRSTLVRTMRMLAGSNTRMEEDGTETQ